MDYFQFSLVQFSSSVMSKSLPPHEPQHARPPCPSPAARVHPNPCPSSRWCHPTISSSTIPFSSCPQSFPALRSFHHLLNTYTIIFAHSSHLCSLLVNYHEQALQVIINFIGWPSSSFEDSLSEKQEKNHYTTFEKLLINFVFYSQIFSITHRHLSHVFILIIHIFTQKLLHWSGAPLSFLIITEIHFHSWCMLPGTCCLSVCLSSPLFQD